MTRVRPHYASCLTTHEPALEFAQQHFSMSVEKPQLAGIGYADRSLGKHIPFSRSAARQQLRSQLIEVGLFKTSGRETLRGYVTEPIIGDDGQVIGIRGTKLNRSAAGPSQFVVGHVQNDDEAPETEVQSSTASRRTLATESIKSTEVDNTEVDNTEVDDIAVDHTEVNEVAEAIQEVTQPATQQSTPDAKPDQAHLEVDGDMIHWIVEDRRYRVGGLGQNATLWSLKVNLLVSREQLVQVDRIDLVKARARDSFSKAAADALYASQEIIRRYLGQLVMCLESFQCQRLQQGLMRQSEGTPSISR